MSGSCLPDPRPPLDADDPDAGQPWSAPPKRRRQPERPKFVVCLDQARRKRPMSRALVMATRPQAEPLFPGCSESESDDSDSGAEDDADNPAAARSPKFVLADVQCLLSYALLTNRSLSVPRWCRLVKPGSVPRLLVVIVEGAAPTAAARLPKFLGHYYQAMRLMSPYACGECIGRELFNLPLQTVARGDRELLEGRLTAQAKQPPRPPRTSVAAAVGAAVVEPPERPAAFPERDKFPRTDLLLSSVQLLHENYPVPGLRSGSSRSASYRTSLPAFRPVTRGSPLYGLDCEMVVTEGGPGSSSMLELARATLVDEAGRVLLDRLVQPPSPVVNFLTTKSGITRDLLEGVTTTLEDVQTELSGLLSPDAILVGHSLNCDLHALRLCHPHCIDTSVIYNLSGSRRHKAALRMLAQRFLGRDIQSDEVTGHNSAEDALAALELVQLKLARSLEFGDAACGHWNPAMAVAAAAGGTDEPPAKRPHCEDPPPQEEAVPPPSGDFHASLRASSGGQTSASLFDWLRMHGTAFRVFDRGGDDDSGDDPVGGLPPIFLSRDAVDDAVLVEAARADMKVSRLVVLRLRCCLEAEAAAAAADQLAALDDPLERLYDALPISSLSIVLLPGRPGDSGSAKCYFNMKGMSKPQTWGSSGNG